jgi:hypothetical protein
MLEDKTFCTEFSFPLLMSYQRISPDSTHMYPFRDKASFYGEELLAPRLTNKLKDHHLSAVRDCETISAFVGIFP